MSALFDSFEYLCYGSTAIINISILLVRNQLYTSESDVYRRPILTYKDDRRAVRVNVVLMLIRRLRHWTSIKTTLAVYLVCRARAINTVYQTDIAKINQLKCDSFPSRYYDLVPQKLTMEIFKNLYIVYSYHDSLCLKYMYR